MGISNISGISLCAPILNEVGSDRNDEKESNGIKLNELQFQISQGKSLLVRCIRKHCSCGLFTLKINPLHHVAKSLR